MVSEIVYHPRSIDMFGPGFTSRRVFNEELANQLQQIVVGRPLKRRALVLELVELFKERSGAC